MSKANFTPKARWVPVLMLAGPDLEAVISTSFYERLPGSFATAAEAVATAWEAQRKRPDAIGASAKREEVPHGL